MVPAEFVAQDHAYRMLKLQLASNARVWRDNVNIVALSEMLSLSRTPVREALFRLLGEGIVEPADHGGYRLYRPDAGQLRDLYVWLAHLLTSSLSMVSDAQVRAMVATIAEGGSDPYDAPWTLFQAIADATGNHEFSTQVHNALERLIAARAVERSVFPAAARETRQLMLLPRSRLKASISRKIFAYFRRRVDQSAIISARLSD